MSSLLVRRRDIEFRRGNFSVKTDVPRLESKNLGGSSAAQKIRGRMHFETLFSLYAGPDQIMTVTSGLASLLGLLLIFWNKVVTLFFKLIGKSRPMPEAEGADPSKSPSEVE